MSFPRAADLSPAPEPGAPFTPPAADGFRGIWYWNQATDDAYAYKYSGGMATYPQQHAPIAIHAPEAGKTFFVYGATDETNSTLLHAISYYDHATGEVARPRILLDKRTTDAHDNPVLGIDDEGHLWVFSNTHGRAPRPSALFRSVKPHDITSFQRIPLPETVFPEHRFNYAQPWWIAGKGLVMPHVQYVTHNNRQSFTVASPDGFRWSAPKALSNMLAGQYQVSRPHGDRIGVMLNVHPHEGVFNARTNLYYLESVDGFGTVTTVDGRTVETPLTDPDNIALVRDYRREGKLVYLKGLTYDEQGHPILLYLLSTTAWPGPLEEARMLHTARWTGEDWDIRAAVPADHNYDFGFLSIDPDGAWRLTGAFLPGPQPFGTGGEAGIWFSRDQGATWSLERRMTGGSEFNHSYLREPLHAAEDFAALWADGDPFVPGLSRLYIADRDGRNVRRLPLHMDTDTALPEHLDFPE